MKIIISINTLICLGLALVNGSCKKFIEIDPPMTQTGSATVYNSEETATSVLLGLYSQSQSRYPGFLSGLITQAAALSADELEFVGGGGELGEFYTNSLQASNSQVANCWTEAYQYIYTTNAVLEGITRSTALSDAARNKLEGEARFLRAFCHFYLFNLFGPVPYVTSADYRSNNEVSRSTAEEIYIKLEEDFTAAASLLPAAYPAASGLRSRPNRAAAKAMLARLALYRGDWVRAASEASEVIGNTSLYRLEPEPSKVFLKSSMEAIFQLEPVMQGFNTMEGNNFILEFPPSTVVLSDFLVRSFDTADRRLLEWTGHFEENGNRWNYPAKYKVKSGAEVTEYYMVIRLAELFLIRAEAMARQNRVSEATADINTIRERAGLSAVTPATTEECIEYIIRERRAELFCEWGHRWLDLKRLGIAAGALQGQKPGWKDEAVLYPIPFAQLTTDPNMTQNAGY